MLLVDSIGARFFRNSSLRLAGVSLAVLTATSVARAGISYTLTDLGTLPGDSSSTAAMINSSGQVTINWGYSPAIVPFPDSDGFYGDLAAEFSGPAGTSANAINASGQIAADATTPSGQEHAVRLTPLSTPTAIALPPAAWAALSALPLLVFGKRIRRAIR